MPFLVYVLYSPKLKKIYVGQTSNLDQRLNEHRRGYSKATSMTDDWEVIYTEECSTRSEAFKREKQLKSSRGRSFIWEIIKKK
jgi:putative endonuclease